MNKQGRLINGKVVGGIEWVKYVLPDGTEIQGFTSNPVKGCKHGCEWDMPDGGKGECYAKTIAEKFRKAYPLGFEHHYWHPLEMEQWHKTKGPARVFLDSMSDLMGHWVSDDEILVVFENVRRASHLTFQMLTKNAPRLLKFNGLFPSNLWVGASVPPSVFKGKRLSPQQQARMLAVTLDTLKRVQAPVKWMSIEPLSWDIAPQMQDCGLQWVVIGAASNGPKVYQPEPEWVANLLATLDAQNIPVFFKGNLKGNPAATPWREAWPSVEVA